MPELDVLLDGADRLASTLGAAVGVLEDGLPATGQDAGDLVIGSAEIPVRTGSLSGSAVADADAAGVTLRAGGQSRGGYTEQRVPQFFGDSLDARLDDVTDLYVQLLLDALDTIQGA